MFIDVIRVLDGWGGRSSLGDVLYTGCTREGALEKARKLVMLDNLLTGAEGATRVRLVNTYRQDDRRHRKFITSVYGEGRELDDTDK